MEHNIINIDLSSDLKNKKIQFLLKRVLDVLLSIIGIIIFSPVFIIVFIAIKREGSGPAIFRQVRVGKDQNNFVIYKFRTMIVNAEKQQEIKIDVKDIDDFVFQNKMDKRITKLGAFLRDKSIDELPQLFNVLIGNMSLVGPRPEIVEVVKCYPEYYKQRLLVKPGMTGLAQINGRGEIALGKTVYYDLTYIKKFSLTYDIKLLFLTFISVIKGAGAM